MGKHIQIKKATIKQSEVNALWSELKSDEAMAKEKIQELERVTSRRKNKLLSFWGKVGYFVFSSICTWPSGDIANCRGRTLYFEISCV